MSESQLDINMVSSTQHGVECHADAHLLQLRYVCRQMLLQAPLPIMKLLELALVIVLMRSCYPVVSCFEISLTTKLEVGGFCKFCFKLLIRLVVKFRRKHNFFLDLVNVSSQRMPSLLCQAMSNLGSITFTNLISLWKFDFKDFKEIACALADTY